MTSPNHGKIVPNEPPGAQPTPGRIQPPQQPGQDNKFYPDPANSIPASFIPDSNPNQPTKGIFSPPSQLGTSGRFQPIDQGLLPQQQGPQHGKTLPEAQGSKPAQPGTLTPSPVPGGAGSWIPDVPSTFVPDKSSGSPVPGTTEPNTGPGQQAPPPPAGTTKPPVKFTPSENYQLPQEPISPERLKFLDKKILIVKDESSRWGNMHS
jgi:hypothetical protein